MKPLISVIVPVYGVEAYLPRCVDSILGQTYQNLEVILVDDGSPDGCGTLCDRYAQQDGRVKVIHQENGGLSSARNTGIEAAQGIFLCFVDGDDFIESRMIEWQLAAANRLESNIVCCGITPKPAPFTAIKAPEYRIRSKEEIMRALLQGELHDTTVCNKLYHKSLIPALMHDEDIHYIEDFLVSYETLKASQRFADTKEGLYHYVARPESLVQSKLNHHHFDALRTSEIIAQREREHPEHAIYYRRRHVRLLLSFLNRIIKSNCHWDRYQALRQEVLSYTDEAHTSGLYTKKERLSLSLLQHCPWAYRLLVWMKYQVARR